jgi:NAD(P)-dependent dehydrogenase (short-subunit alcohol dehydrogenase family)
VKFLIYGATKGRGDGIGPAVALSLLERGHEIRGLCRDAEKVAIEERFPLEAVDLTSPVGQDRLKALIQEYNPDGIWSACGVGYGTPLWTMPDDEIEDMIDANVRNNVVFCRTCAPSCVDGGPHLILTGSVAGVLEGQGASLYAGVKGFLLPFVRGQRVEYRKAGHRPKISLISLNTVRFTGIDVVVDAVEFVARQSCSLEVLVA